MGVIYRTSEAISRYIWCILFLFPYVQTLTPPPRWLVASALTGLGCLITASCKREVENLTPTAAANAYAVTAAQATTVAENIALSPGVLAQLRHNQQTGDTQRVFQGRQRVLSLTALPATDGQPAAYFCNYAQGGFAIIAADQHMVPVLAFAERGTLPTSNLKGTRAIPEGLASWLETTRQLATALRQSTSEKNVAAGAAQSWATLLGADSQSFTTTGPTVTSATSPTPNRPLPEDPPPTDPDPVQVGPLMQITWGQGCGYNDYVTSSNESSYCYHCPTGCVATAQAQVMYYWRYPAYFNWAAMAPSYGTPATAHLMDDLGGKLHMDYNPSNSPKGGSSTDDDYIDDALKGNYGYSSAEYNSSQDPGLYGTVISNLNNRMPVILGGASAANWFGYQTADARAHCWVCEGYLQSYYQGNSYLQYYMNWGWSGQSNGWFAYNDWQVTDSYGQVHNYNYVKTFTVNIHP